MIHDIPPLKLAWFGVSSIFGGAAAVMGYCSRSAERTPAAATIAGGNGLLVGLSAALGASNYADCDPIWLVLGALMLGWATGHFGVLAALAWIWAAKEEIASILEAWNEMRQLRKRKQPSGSQPTPPSVPRQPPDGESTEKPPP